MGGQRWHPILLRYLGILPGSSSVSEVDLPNLYHLASTNPGHTIRRGRGHEQPSRKTCRIRPMRNGTP